MHSRFKHAFSIRVETCVGPDHMLSELDLQFVFQKRDKSRSRTTRVNLFNNMCLLQKIVYIVIRWPRQKMNKLGSCNIRVKIQSILPKLDILHTELFHFDIIAFTTSCG